jgi:hypothetical protein
MIDDLKWFLNNFTNYKKKLTHFGQYIYTSTKDRNLNQLLENILNDIDKKINRII